MKKIFKVRPPGQLWQGTVHDFYTSLLAKGMKPEMARLHWRAESGHYLDTLEKGGTFRRRTTEDASSLSIE